MSLLSPPGAGVPNLTLPHGDLVAGGLILAIHGGGLDAAAAEQVARAFWVSLLDRGMALRPKDVGVSDIGPGVAGTYVARRRAVL
jgi:hypothetical protein